MHPTRDTLSENSRTRAVGPSNRGSSAAIDLHGQLKQAQGKARGPASTGVRKVSAKVAGEADSADVFAEMSRGVDHQASRAESRVASK
jgi:hypothetical protein